eukprot:GDKH01019672.1.p2 GENE.GDKH01019672.1~~GDKH01019672.1.p2  ORF type:complete len:131 (+),score=7.62 GDKH01019672.1:92-484(+)
MLVSIGTTFSEEVKALLLLGIGARFPESSAGCASLDLAGVSSWRLSFPVPTTKLSWTIPVLGGSIPLPGGANPYQQHPQQQPQLEQPALRGGGDQFLFDRNGTRLDPQKRLVRLEPGDSHLATSFYPVAP